MATFPSTTSASDVWDLTDVYRAEAGDNWPSPVLVPGAPTGVSATGGNAQAIVSFTAPVDDGGSSITGYRVTSSPGGITATGSSSPITITGLTNGTAYTFTVAAQNIAGYGPESSASNSVTPAAGRVITVSPAVGGITNWNLDTNGPLSLSTAGTWTLTPASSFNASIKVWGAGAANGQYNSGAGGAAVGVLAMVNGSSYVARVGASNGGGSTAGSAKYGAGYSGIFISSETFANAKIMAGGGGGSDSDDGGRNANGGAGGGDSGQNGQGYSNSYGKGGTQSAGGAGGTASSNGSPGSALTGGAGNTTSGSGYYGGGGGSGYYGGGGGGMQASWAGGGGGGGSGYIGGVTSATNYQGNYTTPGNSGDANRGTSGNTGQPGKVYIY